MLQEYHLIDNDGDHLNQAPVAHSLYCFNTSVSYQYIFSDLFCHPVLVE